MLEFQTKKKCKNLLYNITYLYASQLRDWTIIFILKRYLKGNFEVDNKDKKN